MFQAIYQILLYLYFCVDYIFTFLVCLSAVQIGQAKREEMAAPGSVRQYEAVSGCIRQYEAVKVS
jgi:hypothetical protein